jgi:hypothetical protein
MKTAKQVIHRIKTIAVKEVGGIHFDREEVRALREFAEYCMRGYMGKHAHTVKMILEKVGR